MATANLNLFEQPDRTISFASLCNEVRGRIHECGTFETALALAFRDHDVATALTQEVLSCEVRAEIRKERRLSVIPCSEENLVEYVRVLLHYDIPFPDAMERCCAQYGIQPYSPTSQTLYDRISRALNRRALGVQAKKRTKF